MKSFIRHLNKHHEKSNRSLTEGSIAKGLISFAIPLFLGQLLQQFYNMADAWVVGNFAENEAFAAVSSSGSLSFMLIGFFGGIAIGGGVIISRYFGANDRRQLERAVHTNFLLGLIASALATFAGVVFMPQLLRLMRVPADVMPYSLTYMRIYFGGVSTIIMYNICMSIMRALGDSLRPLYYLVISSVLNVALDLLFVIVFHMGVAGAAAATVIAQGVSVLLCLARMFRSDNEVPLRLSELKFYPDLMRQVLAQGLPTGIQNSVISIGNTVIQSNINSFGSYAMSGHGAYAKLEGFIFLPITCMSMSLPTYISQNLGAGKKDRLKKGALFGILSSMLLSTLFGLGIYFLAAHGIRLFVDEPQAVEFGVIHSRIVGPFFFLLSFSHCCSGVLRGCGKSIIPMITMLSFWCGVRIIYVTAAVRLIPEFRMISWAYPLTWALSSTVLLICFLRLDWMKKGEPVHG